MRFFPDMKKLWDFMCECGCVEERLVDEEDYNQQECFRCGAVMWKHLGGRVAFFDIEKHRSYLRQRSQEHTQQAIKEKRPLNENESGVCSDPVWRNKIRAKNTSRSTIDQHRYDHLKK